METNRKRNQVVMLAAIMGGVFEIDDITQNKLSIEKPHYVKKNSQNLYFVNDDKIKEGDYILCKGVSIEGDLYNYKQLGVQRVHQIGKALYFTIDMHNRNQICNKSDSVKIIASTDSFFSVFS